MAAKTRISEPKTIASKKAPTKSATRSAAGWLRAARNVDCMMTANAGTYRHAVEEVAILLAPRFMSGELRGWLDADSERKGGIPARYVPPLFKLERACTRLFIRSPEAALMVLRCASPGARVEDFDWREGGASVSLLGAAEAAMARDVLHLCSNAGGRSGSPARSRRYGRRGARRRNPSIRGCATLWPAPVTARAGAATMLGHAKGRDGDPVRCGRQVVHPACRGRRRRRARVATSRRAQSPRGRALDTRARLATAGRAGQEALTA